MLGHVSLRYKLRREGGGVNLRSSSQPQTILSRAFDLQAGLG